MRCCERIPDSADQQGDIGPLPAPVRVQFIEHKELQALGRLDKVLLLRPGEQEFQHHVVGQEDIWWVGDGRALLLIRLLACIECKGHRSFTIRVAVVQKLLEFPVLAIRQGVHRIDNDRLNAASAPAPQQVIHNRDDVGEALARSCAGRQHVVVSPLGRADRF